MAASRHLAALLFAGCLSTVAASAQDAGQEAVQAATPDQPKRSFVLQLLGDVEWLTQNTDPPRNSFRLGQLDGFFSADLSERVSVLTEVVVELDEDGEFFIDLERLYVGYRASDAFSVKLGRYHTGIGYYTTVHHHGAYLETAATRPQLFAFEDEGGALPVHELGISMEGEIPAGAVGLRYLFEVGNGQRWTADNPRPEPSVSDPNHNKSTNVGVSVVPDALPGFLAGVNFYRDLIAGPDGQSVSSRFAAGYAVYRRYSLEVMAEAVWMRHRFEQDEAVDNHAFYVQAGRRFGKALVYGRYERTKLDPRTPLIGGLPSVVGPTVGVRIDPAKGIAIKAQVERNEFAPTFGARVQVAFAF